MSRPAVGPLQGSDGGSCRRWRASWASAPCSPARCVTAGDRVPGGACSCSPRRAARRCGASSTTATPANVLEVQSNVALGVAQALQASLAPEERARIRHCSHGQRRSGPGSTCSNNCCRSERPAQNQKGIEVLQKAIALDPDFAVANAALARRIKSWGTVYGRVDYLRGVEAGRNAVRIDPQLARGHFALGERTVMGRAKSTARGCRCSAPSSSTAVPSGRCSPCRRWS